MSEELQFNDFNLNNYQDIPTTFYPVLTGIGLKNVTINHQTQPVANGVLPTSTGAYVRWEYPISENIFIRAAVGYQIQILEGTFAKNQSQGFIPPGNVVHEEIVNLKDNVDPQDRYINLNNRVFGRADILATALIRNGKYTARVRSLIFSELLAGTVGGQHFKYTEWSVVNFRVNNVPVAINLRTNEETNPTKILSDDPIKFSFTFQDTDGPSYHYRIQVGTVPGVGFAANIWDSGTISAGSGAGNKEIITSFSGPALEEAITYVWRVQVLDGLSDGGWTAANDTFKINSKPTVSSLQIDGNEMIYNVEHIVADSGVALSWTFSDPEGETQRAYSLVVVQTFPESGDDAVEPFEILSTGNVFSSSSTVILPDLPTDGGEIEVRLKVRDNVEFSEEIIRSFKVNARPSLLSLRIDEKTNPGNVGTSTPSFDWVFIDETIGDIQSSFQVQVATNETFTSLLWDTGEVISSNNLVVYGSTGSPVIAPTALTHGAYYYVRVRLSDGTSFSEYVSGFFAINTSPNSPTLLNPSAIAYSGNLNITWMPASPLDADGDTITYTLEITTRRSSNQGWEYLAGPFDSSVTSFVLNLSEIKAGNDYGIRVLANDGFTDSNPSLGTSPVNASNLGFTIENHVPSSPVFIFPKEDDVISSTLKIEWLEADPPDVDGDGVFYILEITTEADAASPTYEKIGVFNEGTNRTFLDVSDFTDGSNYRLRITAQDDKGGVGLTNYSETFAIINTPAVNDFENLGTSLYLATSDGQIMRAVETIWQVEENFDAKEGLELFNEFIRGSPTATISNGVLTISSPKNSTYILRIGAKIID